MKQQFDECMQRKSVARDHHGISFQHSPFATSSALSTLLGEILALGGCAQGVQNNDLPELRPRPETSRVLKRYTLISEQHTMHEQIFPSSDESASDGRCNKIQHV